MKKTASRITFALSTSLVLIAVTANAQDANPHAGADPHAAPASDDAPEDVVTEDATLPAGTIDIHVADATGRPLPHVDVTLGVLYNSVAKGESRKRLAGAANDAGVARFAGLDVGSGVAYRPMVLRDGATFSSTPFPLGQGKGMRVLLHVYPVTREVEETLVVSQAMMYAEVKDDRVQIQQAFKIYNFGKNAWVPNEYWIPLPAAFTAFATQQGMTDVGVDALPEKGIKLRGTFGPGQHVVEFKWQLPYAGESHVDFEVGVPPHLAAARILAPSSKGMSLEVDSFEPARSSTDGMGQRVLVTERQVRRDEPAVKSIRVAIKGLPTEGPAKYIATFLALGAVVAGVVLGTRKAPPRDAKRERQQLLAALEGLELGHREGTVGPKTYERARHAIIDDIARTFADEATRKSPGSKPRRSERARS